jgi:hypothetical protein
MVAIAHFKPQRQLSGISMRSLSNYFHKMQGRGENCKVDCYKRNDLDYLFAYPEDYAQASLEWEGKEFKRRPHHPAFEIIFVYSQRDGTLDTYLTGDRKGRQYRPRPGPPAAG